MTRDRYRPDFPWADKPEAVDRLRTYYGAGDSYSQCALKIQTEFGGVLTRSSIGGKVMRAGMKQLRAPKPAPKPKPPVRTERNGFRKPPAQRMVVGRGKNNTYVDAVKMVDLPEITDLPPDTSPDACTIAGLTDWMCRWPLSEPAHDMLYCGAASFGPWCSRHRRLVFKPVGSRR